MAKTGTSWGKGQSGNPRGRPKGTGRSHKLSRLLASESEALIQKALDLALGGDMQALRLCVERIFPVPKDRPIELRNFGDDPTTQANRIVKAMLEGALTASEAQAALSVIESQLRIVEAAELEARVRALEAAYGLA